MWILTAVGFIVYQMWAYIPDRILNHFGIHYIPNKYLAVAVPVWGTMSVVCVIMLYLSYSMMHTHPRQSYFTMQDRHSALAHPRDIDAAPVRNKPGVTSSTSPIPSKGIVSNLKA
jgi:phosphatidylinositol glycan class P protein